MASLIPAHSKLVMSPALIVQQPTESAEQLILLFHGVGRPPEDMVPLGKVLAARFPKAWVVSVQAMEASDLGQGYQWFSIAGITEGLRAPRAAAAVPAFVNRVREWQTHCGIGVNATALIGFSQGAIMALESSRLQGPVAGRVVSIAGRFAELPDAPMKDTTFHLFHGKTDKTVPYANTIQAAERLVALGGDVTADVIPFVGHEINDEIVALVLDRLQHHVPLRLWDEAMRAQPGAPEPDSDRH